LLWALAGRLRRGLRREIAQLARGWNAASSAAGLFAGLEEECRRAEQSRRELDRLAQHVARLRRELPAPDAPLGQRR
jgi:hypothetical protein